MQANQINQSDDTATAWKTSAAEVLDVRPELEEGGEPFVLIMETAERIGQGASLVIIAPFEPAPLYAALDSRGFSHATQCVAADEWVVRFIRDH